MRTVDFVIALRGQLNLFELKTLAFCPTRYKPWADARRCGTVELRAREVPRERLRECVALNWEIFAAPDGHVSPMQRRLNEFPPLQAVVVGGFGEWSVGLAALLQSLSHMGADAWMARMRAVTRGAAQASLQRVMRQQLAACVVRGHAQLLPAHARMVRAGGRRRVVRPIRRRRRALTRAVGWTAPTACTRAAARDQQRAAVRHVGSAPAAGGGKGGGGGGAAGWLVASGG